MASPELALVIDVQHAAWRAVLRGRRPLWRKLIREALTHANLPNTNLAKSTAEISVLLADDATVQQLNKQWRGKDKPTNVLSFALYADDPTAAIAPDGSMQLGDVVLAYETCLAEAIAENKNIADHALHLVLHGVLHLLGFDHETDAAAAHMEKLEIDLLRSVAIANPYLLSQQEKHGSRQ